MLQSIVERIISKTGVWITFPEFPIGLIVKSDLTRRRKENEGLIHRIQNAMHLFKFAAEAPGYGNRCGYVFNQNNQRAIVVGAPGHFVGNAGGERLSFIVGSVLRLVQDLFVLHVPCCVGIS